MTEIVVDARGLRCPLPVIRAAAAARDAAPGSLLTVLWTDPAARHDLPAWARMRGHALVGTVEVGAPTPAEPPDRHDGVPPPAAAAFATTVRITAPSS